MKILICHSDPEIPSRESIDIWRIIRPFAELEKHVDWQIDHAPYPIDPNIIDKETSKVKTDDLVKELERIGQYDIVWTSYFPDATLFDAMMFAGMKYGTKFVMDVDDDMYHIPKSNPIWKTDNIDKNLPEMQYMIENTPYLITSSTYLQSEYKRRRSNPTFLFPNFIGGYKHKPFDNGDKVVIGFFGGVSHVDDVEKTGFMDALRQIMKKYPQVQAGSVGLKLNRLTKSRYTFHPGKSGQPWLTEIWPNINCDIAVAPLEYGQFNRCKTNIKWLETAMIPAAFVSSDTPPYKGSVITEQTGLLVHNTVEAWYLGLERLILDEELRRKLARNANLEVERNWSIDRNWTVLKEIIEEIDGNIDNRDV